MQNITALPAPRRAVPILDLMALRRDPLAMLMQAAQSPAPILYWKFGPQPVYLINHPEAVRAVLVTHHRSFAKGRAIDRARRLLGNGLLTSEGAEHQRQRRLIQPAFHRQRLLGYANTMIAYSQRAVAGWRPGETRDIAEEMMRLTLAIAGKTLFDSDLANEASAIGAALTDSIEINRKLMLPFAGMIERLPLPSVRRLRRAEARLGATIDQMIAERRQDGRDHGDLLSMLLLAQDADGAAGGMSDAQVRDEALTLLLASHETTANALAWACYALSQHPEVEASLHAELDRVLAGRAPSFEDLPQLSYTHMVFSEVLRHYPPAWMIGRRALVEQQIGAATIPAGAIVLLSPYVMHHNPHYYPDPQRFDPQRWLPEAQAARPKFAFFPFGGGPRMCIGESFAWMEGVLLLASIAQRWRMRLAPDQMVALQPLITLRPRYGMRMQLEPRAAGGAIDSPPMIGA